MISPTLARAWAASSSGPTRFSFVAAARRTRARHRSISPASRRPAACSQRGDLVCLDLVIHGEDLQRLLVRLDKRIHADDQLPLGVDFALVGKRGIGDLAAEEAGFDGGDHAAGGFDAVEVRPGVVLQLVA